MNKKFVFFSLFLILAIAPFVMADTPTIGNGVGLNISVGSEFNIWMDPDSRVFYRNPADGGLEMVERTNNYAFEGEQIAWQVLVMEKAGVEDIQDVYVTLGATQGNGNDKEVNCDLNNDYEDGDDITSFNPRIEEEQITDFDGNTMAVYDCLLTVETPNSMYGEYWIVGEAENANGNQVTFDENEYWFFNPVIAMTIDGGISFENVRPGSASYSDTLRIENDADDGSGVLLDMQISGTDFYDPASSGAKCPLSNRLRLNSGGTGHNYESNILTSPAVTFARSGQTNCDNPAFSEVGDNGDDLATETQFDAFCYYATNGAYSTNNDVIRRDVEGYVGIPYETGEESDRAPIISSTNVNDLTIYGLLSGDSRTYFSGNVLTPGADMSVTFRVFLPEPCNGAFSDGQVYFWGEAI